MRGEMVNSTTTRKAARDLYERYGGSALDIAQERAERLSRDGDFPVLDMALLVLTEVERLVGHAQQTRRFQYSQPQ